MPSYVAHICIFLRQGPGWCYFNAFWPVSWITLMRVNKPLYSTSLEIHCWKTLIIAQPGMKNDGNKKFCSAKLHFHNKCSPPFLVRVTQNETSREAPVSCAHPLGEQSVSKTSALGVRADGLYPMKNTRHAPNRCRQSLALTWSEGGGGPSWLPQCKGTECPCPTLSCTLLTGSALQFCKYMKTCQINQLKIK